MRGGERGKGRRGKGRRGEGKGGEGRGGKGKERAISRPTIWRKFTPMFITPEGSKISMTLSDL